jgi:hypothetical protein
MADLARGAQLRAVRYARSEAFNASSRTRSWSLAALGVRAFVYESAGGSACPSCTSIPYMSK